MCGICGATGVADTTRLRAMTDAMVHRGPDDEGHFLDREHGVGLGARRLSIIDLDGGHQPLSNEDGTVWAALNGEIYNFPELRDELERAGHRFRSRTDTEILVHLYEEYGRELMHALEGMYAFAVWDSRRRVLVLARDRFGEKPLFWSEQGPGLTFASEVTALRAGLPGSPDLDPAALDDFFVWGYVTGERSMFTGIHSLPPASTLVWEEGSTAVSVERYWSTPAHPAPAEAFALPELLNETRHLLDRAVESRLLADVPVGVFLSGGVDSALVTALAARHTDGELQSFTVGYDTGDVSETAKAAAVARQLGVRHHEVVMTGDDVAARVPRLMATLDQPLADQATVALHAVCEAAREHVKVVVGGEGADELFSGYPRYRWMALAARIAGNTPEGARAAAFRALQFGGESRRASRLRDLVEPVSLRERQVAWVTARRARRRSELYGPRMTECIARSSITEPLSTLDGAASSDSIETQLMRFDQDQWLPDDVLVKADRASMQVSLELRTPYLNRELAEFAAAVSPSWHRRRGGKFLLREVLDELVPSQARSEQKVAFRVPAAEWLRGPLRPVFEQQLADGSLFREGWFQRDAVTKLFRAHCSEEKSSTEVLWPILCAGLWADAGESRRQS